MGRHSSGEQSPTYPRKLTVAAAGCAVLGLFGSWMATRSFVIPGSCDLETMSPGDLCLHLRNGTQRLLRAEDGFGGGPSATGNYYTFAQQQAFNRVAAPVYLAGSLLLLGIAGAHAYFYICAVRVRRQRRSRPKPVWMR